MVRQLPQSVSNLLDDKVELHRLLHGAGVAGECVPEGFLSDISDEELDRCVAERPQWESCRWFVKYARSCTGYSRTIEP